MSFIFYKLHFLKGWKLQRTNQNISQLVNHVDSFRRKLQVLKSHLNDNIFHFFPSCQIFLEEHDNNCNFKEYIYLKESLYPNLWDFGLRIHSMLGSRYLCEISFLKMKLIKNERLSTLSDDSLPRLMRLATYNTQIDVSDLANKRFRKSEWIFFIPPYLFRLITWSYNFSFLSVD